VDIYRISKDRKANEKIAELDTILDDQFQPIRTESSVTFDIKYVELFENILVIRPTVYDKSSCQFLYWREGMTQFRKIHQPPNIIVHSTWCLGSGGKKREARYLFFPSVKQGSLVLHRYSLGVERIEESGSTPIQLPRIIEPITLVSTKNEIFISTQTTIIIASFELKTRILRIYTNEIIELVKPGENNLVLVLLKDGGKQWIECIFSTTGETVNTIIVTDGEIIYIPYIDQKILVCATKSGAICKRIK